MSNSTPHLLDKSITGSPKGLATILVSRGGPLIQLNGLLYFGFFPKKKSIHRHHFEVGVTKKLLEGEQRTQWDRGGLLPINRLISMCHWMGSNFHDWIDYNGVAFSIEITRMGSLIFWSLRVANFWQVAGFKNGKIHGK